MEVEKRNREDLRQDESRDDQKGEETRTGSNVEVRNHMGDRRDQGKQKRGEKERKAKEEQRK